MKYIVTFMTIMSIGISLLKAPVPIEAMTLEARAEAASMSLEDFVLISSVTEAESNRCQDSTEGRRYIALCILCRVRDTRFPDTIRGVLTQSGQFSTVRNGHSVTNRTDLSDQAVIEAVQWMNSGEDYPWLLFFNCRGYATGSYYTGYACVGGNYFSIAEPSLPNKLMEGGATN